MRLETQGKETEVMEDICPLKENLLLPLHDTYAFSSASTVQIVCNHQLKHFKVTGQTKCFHLKRVKISSKKKTTTWQPLPRNIEEYLQSMMESVILGILNKNIKRKEQIQYHLNQFKKRLLQQCATLKVPPRKLNFVTDVSKLLKMEKAQERVNEENLASLQEEIDRIVETTESMTKNIQSLKNKIQILTNEVEKAEREMKQVFHIDSNKVLALPELSQKSLKAPILQKEILALIPNQNALLKDLDVLHNSAPVKSMSAFIQEAYRKLDGS
ncbi:centromere protein Q isoform X2 [Mastomys coucha]|uniref:centromere protein Q isoform X2 n=1 Tax=Mastomys coucha TaxID=35658 RepID=UPI00126277A7|nr:centromere protein Q isoform X2 [Mastomys coucha]